MDRTDRVARPSFTFPRRWVVASALLALAAVAGCSSSSSSAAGGATATSSGTASSAQADVSNVTLHIGDQAGTGAQALLTAAGLIGKLPFKVAWSDFTSGPPILQAMAAGSVDVGGVGNAPPVFAAAGDDKIAIVGALQANPKGSALLVPKGSSIHSVAQLKGKRIAVAQGSSADYHLLTVLNKAGISVHDVTLVYLQPAAGLAALTSGHVDAWDVRPRSSRKARAERGHRDRDRRDIRQPVLVHRRVTRRARGHRQGRRDRRLPVAARAGPPLGQQPPVRLGGGLGQGQRPAAHRDEPGGQRRLLHRGADHASRGRLRAAGRRRVHQGRLDPGARGLQPVRRHLVQHHRGSPDAPAAPQRLPDERRPPRGGVAAAGERPVRRTSTWRTGPDLAQIAERGKLRLDLPRRRPGRCGATSAAGPAGALEPTVAADRAGGGDQPHRADRHRVDDLQRARTTWRAASPRSTTSAAAGPAGTSSPRPARRGRATSASTTCPRTRALRARRRVRRRVHRSCGTAGRTTRSSATRPPGVYADAATDPPDRPRRRVLPGARPAQRPALAAGPPAAGAGRLVARTAGPSPRATPRRSSPRSRRWSDGAGVLRRPQARRPPRSAATPTRSRSCRASCRSSAAPKPRRSAWRTSSTS